MTVFELVRELLTRQHNADSDVVLHAGRGRKTYEPITIMSTSDGVTHVYTRLVANPFPSPLTGDTNDEEGGR